MMTRCKAVCFSRRHTHAPLHRTQKRAGTRASSAFITFCCAARSKTGVIPPPFLICGMRIPWWSSQKYRVHADSAITQALVWRFWIGKGYGLVIIISVWFGILELLALAWQSASIIELTRRGRKNEAPNHSCNTMTMAWRETNVARIGVQPVS